MGTLAEEVPDVVVDVYVLGLPHLDHGLTCEAGPSSGEVAMLPVSTRGSLRLAVIPTEARPTSATCLFYIGRRPP